MTAAAPGTLARGWGPGNLAGLFPMLVATLLAMLFPLEVSGRPEDALPGTEPLEWTGDLSARMVEGIDRFLLGRIALAAEERHRLWKPDFSSPEAYERSIEPNRARLRKRIGAVDARLPCEALELVTTTSSSAKVGETEAYEVLAVRWPVFPGVHGEGLLLRPKREPVARIIAIPDADVAPEALAGIDPGSPPEAAFAATLASNGCLVVVPAVIDRSDRWSGNAALGRFTNQPHREWVYRQAYEMGRHIIGYEVSKALALADWFEREGGPGAKIAVAGHGEGGLIALHAAALDRRIQAALVSGHFDARERVWEEPIYRNVFGLLEEFGDAEVASLIAPRSLIVEHAPAPSVEGPPAPRDGRSGAAPGRIRTPALGSVEKEVSRALRAFHSAGREPGRPYIRLISGPGGGTIGPWSDEALAALLDRLGAPVTQIRRLRPPGAALASSADRGRRQLDELVEHTQRLLRESESVRRAFWKEAVPARGGDWARACAGLRKHLREQVIGAFPAPSIPASPRSRRIQETPAWIAHEVVLDVWPDVFAWGYLLVPRGIPPGERRPVVVCQHGLEGVPADVVTSDTASRAYPIYKAFAARLAEMGFVTYAPHNPYRGQDAFRGLQRKANPLGKSLFSIILGQHERTLEWLRGLPFVDPERIGFYGLSYGGKTAMRIPALVGGYALSICSADFNEWIRKNVTCDDLHSYVFTGEYEMFEFDLGSTFNYAEMAALIAPRPFMVERGHHDGVAPDEWVAYEYAKVRYLYAALGIPERTEIEFFDGPHAIHGEGTFRFIRKHLRWPE